MSLLRKLFSPVGFALAILCFALPFLSVSCDSPAGSIGVDVSGVNMVAGTEPTVKTTGLFAENPNGVPDTGDDEGTAGDTAGAGATTRIMSVAMRLAAIGSLFMIVVALALSLVRRSRIWSIASMAAGAVGTAALIGAVVFLKREILDAAQEAGRKGESLVTANMIESMIHVRYGFWLALSFLTAAVVGLVVDLRLGAGRLPYPPGYALPVQGTGPSLEPPSSPPPPTVQGSRLE